MFKLFCVGLIISQIPQLENVNNDCQSKHTLQLLFFAKTMNSSRELLTLNFIGPGKTDPNVKAECRKQSALILCFVY